MEGATTREFHVQITEKSVVKASSYKPEAETLALSNLDLLSGRFPVTYFYFYCAKPGHSFSSIVKVLKDSLSNTLTHYYPFAGCIVPNSTSGEPEILCVNNGALFIEARANIPLKELNFYNLNQILQGKLVSLIHPDFPVQVQATDYTCGGVSVTFTFDHALGDASAFGKFLVSWSEISQKKPVSCIPDHRRHLLRARSPPFYHPSLDQNFVKCTIQEILNMPTPKLLLKRLYHIDGSSINHLQRLASSNGERRTKIEAFSAYIWKVMISVIDDKSHSKCKMGWLVDGRSRMCRDQKDHHMYNYIGNVLSLAVGEASLVEIKQGSLSDIGNIVHEAIAKVANEEHFLDLIDWIECHRPGLMLSKVVLGRGGGGPAVVVSSGRRFPVAQLDFGFGNPVLGTVCSVIEKLGIGYLNQRPSGRGDDSWTVSAILWPELAAALESGTVFQPMFFILESSIQFPVLVQERDSNLVAAKRSVFLQAQRSTVFYRQFIDHE